MADTVTGDTGDTDDTNTAENDQTIENEKCLKNNLNAFKEVWLAWIIKNFHPRGTDMQTLQKFG